MRCLLLTPPPLQVIVFIIKRIVMQPANISEFTLAHPDSDQPRLPSILRSRHRTEQHEHPQPAPEIIVNVQHKGSSHAGIRAEIDACLTAVGAVYQEQKQGRSENRREGRPVGSAIHRVDGRLITEFMTAIEQDYGFSSKFGPVDPALLRKLGQNVGQQQDPYGSAPRTAASRKTYLQLTQGSKRDPSRSVTRRKPQPHTSPRSPLPSSYKPRETSLFQPERVREDFRFCINCEQAILSLNIDYHEHTECPGLQELYRMPFGELRGLLEGKVQRIRGELGQRVGRIRSEGEAICGRVAEKIEGFVGRPDSKQYGEFRQATENAYAQSVELTQKLNWFLQVLTHLNAHSAPTAPAPPALLARLTHPPLPASPLTRSPLHLTPPRTPPESLDASPAPNPPQQEH